MGNKVESANSPDFCRKTNSNLHSFQLISILILITGVACLYYRVVVELVNDWSNDPNYSHGFLVPLFSIYLAWEQRNRLKSIDLRGSWWGLPVLLVGLFALILGEIGAEFFVTRSSLIIVLSGLVLMNFGIEAFKLQWFPLFFLVFMIPLPAIIFNSIAFPLQNVAAKNAAWALDFLGVPVLLDGNVLHLSHYSLGVTEACSGIRSLVSLLTLAVVWAYFAFKEAWPRLILVLSVMPISIAANSARVVATGLIAQYFGIEYAEGFYHTLAGWLIFVVAFLGLLSVHGLIHAFKNHNEKGAK